MARLYLYGARMCIPGYEQCPIKIGITGNPEARFRGFKASLPFPIEWLGAWPAKKGREAEQRVFSAFQQQRLGGEWFYPSDALLEFIMDNVKNYKALIELKTATARTVDGRIPKDINSWMPSIEIWAYDAFEAHFHSVTRLVGNLCAKCGAEPPEPEAIKAKRDWQEKCREAIASNPNPWLTEKDAMHLLSITKDQFAFLIKNRAITHARLGKYVRFRSEYLLDFLNTRWAQTTIPALGK